MHLYVHPTWGRWNQRRLLQGGESRKPPAQRQLPPERRSTTWARLSQPEDPAARAHYGELHPVAAEGKEGGMQCQSSADKVAKIRTIRIIFWVIRALYFAVWYHFSIRDESQLFVCFNQFHVLKVVHWIWSITALHVTRCMSFEVVTVWYICWDICVSVGCVVSSECLFADSQHNLFWFLDEALRLKPDCVCCSLVVDTLSVKVVCQLESFHFAGVEEWFFLCLFLCDALWPVSDGWVTETNEWKNMPKEERNLL